MNSDIGKTLFNNESIRSHVESLPPAEQIELRSKILEQLKTEAEINNLRSQRWRKSALSLAALLVALGFFGSIFSLGWMNKKTADTRKRLQIEKAELEVDKAHLEMEVAAIKAAVKNASQEKQSIVNECENIKRAYEAGAQRLLMVLAEIKKKDDAIHEVRGRFSTNSELSLQRDLEKFEAERKELLLELNRLEAETFGIVKSFGTLGSNGKTIGWIFAPFLRSNEVAVTRVNVREAPQETSRVITRLERGNSVRQLRVEEEWALVEIESNQERRDNE